MAKIPTTKDLDKALLIVDATIHMCMQQMDLDGMPIEEAVEGCWNLYEYGYLQVVVEDGGCGIQLCGATRKEQQAMERAHGPLARYRKQKKGR